RMAARGDELLRAGGSDPPAGQRRRAAALEHVRAADHARPAPRPGARGARRAAVARVSGFRVQGSEFRVLVRVLWFSGSGSNANENSERESGSRNRNENSEP